MNFKDLCKEDQATIRKCLGLKDGEEPKGFFCDRGEKKELKPKTEREILIEKLKWTTKQTHNNFNN